MANVSLSLQRLLNQNPTPPTDLEKLQYDKKNDLYMSILQILSASGITYSATRFALQNSITILFLYPIIFFVFYIFINGYVQIAGSKEFSLSQHSNAAKLFKKSSPSKYPVIDIFLPSSGEPLDLLENTYKYVAKLDWPKSRINFYILDDSNRSQLKILARKFGFKYLTRPDRGRLAKAGNLLYGYERSTGDLIAIFDADFVPNTSYLLELVPYFIDETIGIIQSPQYFDTIFSKNWIEKTAGAVQELFYRRVQVSRSNLGAPICCGTCAIYRRSALVKSGGFAQIEHSEDVHTGVNLMKVGFRVSYVPLILSKGKCPDNLRSFFSQQYRWCSGSMSLMKSQEFWRFPMPASQRVCFASGFLYYIFTGIWIFIGLIPIVSMALFFPAGVILENYIPLIPAMIYQWVFLPNWHRTPYKNDISTLKLFISYAHLAALIDTYRGNLQKWVVSGSTVKTKGRYDSSRNLILIVSGIPALLLTLTPLFRSFVQNYLWYDWFPMFIFGLILLLQVIKLRRFK
jgi:cellulose synthase/poly-beta-1,6-N-acetylglucosamine synthase-like glycosyltransferase